MCILLRNTAHQRPVLILLNAIASEWLNPHYEMSLACKNWACFQWRASPCPSTNKRFCLSVWHDRHPDRNHHSCTWHLFAVITPTTKTESLHPIQTIMAKLIQHLWEKSHNEYLIDPRRCERVQSNSKRLETKQVHFPYTDAKYFKNK